MGVVADRNCWLAAGLVGGPASGGGQQRRVSEWAVGGWGGWRPHRGITRRGCVRGGYPRSINESE